MVVLLDPPLTEKLQFRAKEAAEYSEVKPSGMLGTLRYDLNQVLMGRTDDIPAYPEHARLLTSGKQQQPTKKGSKVTCKVLALENGGGGNKGGRRGAKQKDPSSSSSAADTAQQQQRRQLGKTVAMQTVGREGFDDDDDSGSTSALVIGAAGNDDGDGGDSGDDGTTGSLDGNLNDDSDANLKRLNNTALRKKATRANNDKHKKEQENKKDQRTPYDYSYKDHRSGWDI